MSFLGIQNFPASADNLTLALSAGSFAAAGTGKIDSFGCKRTQQRAALLHLNGVLAVNSNLDRSGRREIILGNKQYDYQCENDGKKDTDARQNK